MTTLIYDWKACSYISLNPQLAGEHLEQLRLQNGGHLTAHKVLDDARPPSSPTHPHFTWDDQRAAEERRLQQAGHLLRCLIVTRVNGEQSPPTRAMVVVTEGDEQHYTSIFVALEEPDLHRQLLERASSELAAFQRKYAGLKELRAVHTAAIKFIGSIKPQEEQTNGNRIEKRQRTTRH